MHLGVWDTPAWIVSKANQYARDHGLRQFILYQGLWNAAKRDIERQAIPMARDEGIALAPWSPIGAGTFEPKDILDKASQSSRDAVITETDRKVSAALETPYVFPIVGCTKAEHLESNIARLAYSSALRISMRLGMRTLLFMDPLTRSCQVRTLKARALGRGRLEDLRRSC